MLTRRHALIAVALFACVQGLGLFCANGPFSNQLAVSMTGLLVLAPGDLAAMEFSILTRHNGFEFPNEFATIVVLVNAIVWTAVIAARYLVETRRARKL